jgi:hypothetical protein
MWEWLSERKKEREDGRKLAQLYARGCRDVEELGRTVQRLEKDRERMRARIGELQAAPSGDGVPELRPGEVERLALLTEACGRATQKAAAVLRFGWDAKSPHTGTSNDVALERELGNVRAVVNLMLDAGDVRLAELQSWQRAKKGTLAKWTHDQADSMPREAQLEMIRSIELERMARGR